MKLLLLNFEARTDCKSTLQRSFLATYFEVIELKTKFQMCTGLENYLAAASFFTPKARFVDLTSHAFLRVDIFPAEKSRTRSYRLILNRIDIQQLYDSYFDAPKLRPHPKGSEQAQSQF